MQVSPFVVSQPEDQVVCALPVGFAFNVTVAPEVNGAEQVPPADEQLEMPVGVDDTVPLRLPLTLTVRIGRAANVTVTARLDVSWLMRQDVVLGLLSHPDQVTVAPPEGEAVSVTWVP